MTKVLVIEDEELLRESILNILSRRGFSVFGARDGREGLQLAKDIIPDLILSNIRMPELDGYQVLRAIRQDPITAKVSFIFLTAEISQDMFRQGQILGANGYLAKPFTIAELLQAIAIHITPSSPKEYPSGEQEETENK